jgi:hypothetical protein
LQEDGSDWGLIDLRRCPSKKEMLAFGLLLLAFFVFVATLLAIH